MYIYIYTYIYIYIENFSEMIKQSGRDKLGGWKKFPLFSY